MGKFKIRFRRIDEITETNQPGTLLFWRKKGLPSQGVDHHEYELIERSGRGSLTIIVLVMGYTLYEGFVREETDGEDVRRYWKTEVCSDCKKRGLHGQETENADKREVKTLTI